MRNLLIGLAILYTAPQLCYADYTIYDIPPFFRDDVGAFGYEMTVMEELENNNLNKGDSYQLPIQTFEFGEPLLHPDGFGFPDGLSTDLMVLNPLGTNPNLQWAVVKGGSLGGPDNTQMLFAEPIEFSLVEDDVTAFALRLGTFIDGFYFIDVLDNSGNVVFSDEFDSIANFFGVIADDGDTIGSVVITPATDPFTIGIFDNIQVFNSSQIPEPGCAAIMISGFCFACNRRRRS